MASFSFPFSFTFGRFFFPFSYFHTFPLSPLFCLFYHDLFYHHSCHAAVATTTIISTTTATYSHLREGRRGNCRPSLFFSFCPSRTYFLSFFFFLFAADKAYVCNPMDVSDRIFLEIYVDACGWTASDIATTSLTDRDSVSVLQFDWPIPTHRVVLTDRVHITPIGNHIVRVTRGRDSKIKIIQSSFRA